MRSSTSVWLWPLILILSSVAVAATAFAEFVPIFHPLVAAWFLLVCPGMAFVRLLKLEDTWVEWTLAIFLSLTLEALVAGIMLYAQLWSPALGLVILIGFCVIGATLQLDAAMSTKYVPTLSQVEQRKPTNKTSYE